MKKVGSTRSVYTRHQSKWWNGLWWDVSELVRPRAQSKNPTRKELIGRRSPEVKWANEIGIDIICVTLWPLKFLNIPSTSWANLPTSMPKILLGRLIGNHFIFLRDFATSFPHCSPHFGNLLITNGGVNYFPNHFFSKINYFFLLYMSLFASFRIKVLNLLSHVAQLNLELLEYEIFEELKHKKTRSFTLHNARGHWKVPKWNY